ncbi:hypothetical protein BKA69DRAFT_1035005 [Paraphysoderma sedebokerense]|nr:hypothetical protein BKA69DRAFT_1035005 [Paraphysoderma sedebokerense]
MIALSKRILSISIFLIYCADAIADHIQLTSPDANSVWTAGTEQTITWNLIGDTKADDKDDEKKKNEKDDAKNLMVDVEILRASDGFVLGGDPVVQSVAKGTPASTQKITFQLSDSLKGVYYVKIFRPKSNIFDLKSQHTSQSAKFQILGKDARTPAATTSSRFRFYPNSG